MSGTESFPPPGVAGEEPPGQVPPGRPPRRPGRRTRRHRGGSSRHPRSPTPSRTRSSSPAVPTAAVPPAGLPAAGPPALSAPGVPARHARRRPQAGRDPAAAAPARRHVRRGVPHHPLQPQGDRRVCGPGHRRGDADPGPGDRGPHLDGRPDARRERRQPQHRRGRRSVRRVRLDVPGLHPPVARADPGHGHDRSRHDGRRRRQEALAGRGVGRHRRQALAADRAGGPAGSPARPHHRHLRDVVGGGGVGARRRRGGGLRVAVDPRVLRRSCSGSGSGSTTCRCRR